MIGTVSGLFFPMITFPYVTRVIMADGIGQVQFYSSIINYIIIFTSLGIPLYATREIARNRANQSDLSRTTVEILSLNLILNVLGYTAVFLMCLTVEQVRQNIPLFLLLSTSIFLTSIGCPWFFSGIEDFKYVTLRGLLIKVICVIFLFVFVRDKDDLMYYGAYTVLGSIGNYLLNFYRLRKHIRLDSFKFRELKIWRHLKPALSVFILNLVVSIYVNLDKVMVGFLKDNVSVGYYTAASTLSHILLTMVTSLGSVMLPRLSNLVKQGDMESFHRLAKKSYDFIVTISLPICGGLIILSPSLIRIFCGETFIPAVPTLRIISPIIVAIGISNLIGIQILYPLGKIKIVTISTIVGAITNFLLNLLLIPKLAQNGAAIATLSAEICVTCSQIILAHKYIPFKLFDRILTNSLFGTLLMMLACSFFMQLRALDIINIIAIPLIGILVYLTIMILTKNVIIVELFQMIKYKIKK